MKKINIIGLDKLREEYKTLSTDEQIEELYGLIGRLIDFIECLNEYNISNIQTFYDIAKYIIEVEQGVKHEDIDELPTYFDEAYLDVLYGEDDNEI